MKRIVTKSLSLLLAALLLVGLSATALGADSTVTFKSLEEGFDFQPGSEYSATDLFCNFKDVMPGDHRTQTVRLKNEAADCDFINLYLRAATGEGEDFLSQLALRIYDGGRLIYEASPGEADALADNVFLGSLNRGQTLDLRVELDVPDGLGNEYAARVGEVDWFFLAEGVVYSKLTVHKVWEDNGYPERPEKVLVRLLKDGEVSETVELNGENQWTHTWDGLDDRYSWSVEEEAVEGYETSYRTEGNLVFIANHRDYTPQPAPAPRALTVKKAWASASGKDGSHPDSVSVTLYNGSQAVDTVTLSAKNDWAHTWKDLDGSGDWSVLETGIPKGYTPSYRTDGEVVTITNTEALIQTGQTNWPIPALALSGLALMAVGVFAITGKRRKERA